LLVQRRQLVMAEVGQKHDQFRSGWEIWAVRESNAGFRRHLCVLAGRARNAQSIGGGFAMFAPPISKQIARAQRAPAPAASCVQEEMTEQRSSVPSAPTKTAATQRTSPRAAASNQTAERAPPC
jgi:hypothetical protein